MIQGTTYISCTCISGSIFASVLLLGNEGSLLMDGRVSVLDPDTSSILVVMLVFSLYNSVGVGGCPG